MVAFGHKIKFRNCQNLFCLVFTQYCEKNSEILDLGVSKGRESSQLDEIFFKFKKKKFFLNFKFLQKLNFKNIFYCHHRVQRTRIPIKPTF